jgi:hypothetical protein
LESIQLLRKTLTKWKNAEQLSDLLDEIEASKLIISSLYKHPADKILRDFLLSYNKILHELLHQAIVEGAN